MHAHQTPPKVTVAELLRQLTVTQAELENIKVNVFISVGIFTFLRCHYYIDITRVAH